MGACSDGCLSINAAGVGAAFNIVGAACIVVNQLASVLFQSLGGLFIHIPVCSVAHTVSHREISGEDVGREAGLAVGHIGTYPNFKGVHNVVLGELGEFESVRSAAVCVISVLVLCNGGSLFFRYIRNEECRSTVGNNPGGAGIQRNTGEVVGCRDVLRN